MIISHAHRFIFLKTQKCAGTSIELALSTICGPQDVISLLSEDEEEYRRQIGGHQQNDSIPLALQPVSMRVIRHFGFRKFSSAGRFYSHMPAVEIRRFMDPQLFDSYRKVTVVRNPWDREVSRYYGRYRDSKKPASFEHYIRWPRYKPDRKTFRLYSIDNKIVADTVMRYENLQTDFEAFVRSLGIEHPVELPRAKGKFRPQSERNYRNLYTPETAAIVARRYAREISAFGYQF